METLIDLSGFEAVFKWLLHIGSLLPLRKAVFFPPVSILPCHEYFA